MGKYYLNLFSKSLLFRFRQTLDFYYQSKMPYKINMTGTKRVKFQERDGHAVQPLRARWLCGPSRLSPARSLSQPGSRILSSPWHHGEVQDGRSRRCLEPGVPQPPAPRPPPRAPAARPSSAVWRQSGPRMLMGDKPYPGPVLLPVPSWQAPRDPEVSCTLRTCTHALSCTHTTCTRTTLTHSHNAQAHMHAHAHIRHVHTHNTHTHTHTFTLP